ncbi:hypothetical protein PTW37_04975 [Arthrobacter agilis]|uniref:hypothetical protein n=1 Tax=Arthrobacter agilis TaxID=37921 RepID=UPI002366212B|nr:hypothetical protein [Arthrobacter agilis]WDF34276.1 hypothetical protein PTW37_04975 [Arthrobacter agilis]
MQLLAWIAACAVLAGLLRARPVAAIICVLALWFFVPTVGSYLLTGQRIGPLTFHAASWLTFAILGVQLLQNPRSLASAVARHSYLFLILVLIFAVSFLTTRTVQESGGTVLFIDQMVAPAVLFLLVVAAGPSAPKLVSVLRASLLLFASIVTAIAIWQWVVEDVLFYESGFLTQFWFNPETERWMGTFDQPLALSLVLCALMPLVAGIRRLVLAVPMIALFLSGVLISQSRVGLVVASAGAVYAIAVAEHRRSAKVLTLSLMGLGFVYLLTSPLAEGLLGRVADDTGSTEARNQAYGVFLRDWRHYFFTGDGITSSYGVAEYAGLQTSFESSLLMYAVDIGIVFAVLYFGALTLLVLRNRSRHSVPGLTLAGLAVVLIPQTYSGLATRSVAGVVVWTIVALIVVAAERASSPSGPRRGGVDDRIPIIARPAPSVPDARRARSASTATWMGR